MKTGVIGLGAMGAHMARNLASKNKLQSVYNRTTAKAETLARECAVQMATTPANLAQQCELVIICVSRDADVLQMIDAIQPALQAGYIVVDTSTVSADTAIEASKRLQKCDASFLDCPVSGGVEGAKNGTLAMMVGAQESTQLVNHQGQDLFLNGKCRSIFDQAQIQPEAGLFICRHHYQFSRNVMRENH